MEAKERILEMYTMAAKKLVEASHRIHGTEIGSEERDHAERLFGERQAYGRILKELYGVQGTELQSILDDIHAGRR
ncbi:MAG: hypothetical protein ACI4PO_09170 [Faecousia sp.]